MIAPLDQLPSSGVGSLTVADARKDFASLRSLPEILIAGDVYKREEGYVFKLAGPRRLLTGAPSGTVVH